MRLAALALVGFGLALFASLGCSSTCTSGCSRQYDDCMKTATGAAHSDCQAAYQRCTSSCTD